MFAAKADTMHSIYGKTLAALIILSASIGSNAQTLKEFRRPPADCGPKTWWFFGYEATTEAGIAADVESFRDAGFSGVVYYDQNHASTPSPRADEGLSEAWWQHLETAAREVQKAGLSLEMNLSDGYVAGGRWIDPPHAMQRVSAATIQITGGRAVDIALPPIEGRDGYVEDIALLAFPSVTDSLKRHFTARYAVKGKGRNGAMQIPGPRGEFSGAKWQKRDHIGVLQCSDDSLHWRDVLELEPMYASQGVYPFRTNALPATKANYWRISYFGEDRLKEWSVGNEAKLDRWEEKAALQSDFSEPGPALLPDGGGVINPQDIIDLSGRVDSNGTLRWEVPEGTWTLLRLAATLTGAKIKHGRANLRGYECDKLSAEAAQLHWDSYPQAIIDRLRADGLDCLEGICMDSHEAGSQNWTPRMLQEFQTRRGYRLEPWLPLLAGYVVESPEKSEAVLRDFRQTINDCITDNYYGTFQRLATENGLRFTAQAIGNSLCIPGDAVAVKKAVEKPQGECWAYQQTGAYDIKDCSSAAHLYGKPIASAESFTDATYADTPQSLGRVANLAFAFGAQELVICATPHIPEVNPAGPYVAGREYAINRSNPQWDSFKPLWKACARSAYLLRQGVAAPDVLVYLGDDLPVKTLTHRLPAGLEGLDWDVCTGDALRTRLHVTPDGCLSTPDGVVYRALLIGDDAYVSPGSAKTLEDFRAAGVRILTEASSLERPLQILQDPDSFAHTHRRTNGHEWFFLANLKDCPMELTFRLAAAPTAARLWRTADGSRSRLRPTRQGIYTVPLAPGESVFVEY